MSDTRFTPGPWELWTGCSWRRFGSGSTGEKVCVPVVLHDGQPDLSFPNGGQGGPDVFLILAAPDMYEALKRVLEDVQNMIDDDAIINVMDDIIYVNARAAIAKAEGKL